MSELSDFESCASSIPEDQEQGRSAANELEESPFFRNRSSSDSAVMGNNINNNNNHLYRFVILFVIGNKATKGKGRLVFNPRLGTETQQQHETNRSPPAIFSQNEHSSSTQQQLVDDDTRDQEEQQQTSPILSKVVIDKSHTSETLYADVDEPEEIEDPSSYKDIAHHHTWTCDENLLIVSETSDSINVPDLPLDSNGTETCSLKDVLEFENAGTFSLSSGLEQPTSDNTELDADTSPYATELYSRSHELEHLKFKEHFKPPEKHILKEKSVCLTFQENYTEVKLQYLALEVPDLIPNYIVATRYHILKIYAEKNKSVSFI